MSNVQNPMLVTFGEVMMRLSPPGAGRFGQTATLHATYGGTEANVAVSVARLGVATRHVTVLPDHALGRAGAGYLASQGVDTRYVQFGTGRLGLYFSENGSGPRAGTIIYDRADSAFSRITEDAVDWDVVLADARWLHWTGITPALSAGAAACLLRGIQTANRLGIPVSGDPVYRSNLWQYGQRPQDILPALTEGCTLLLGNAGLFRQLYGRFAGAVDATDVSTPDNVAAAEAMQQRFPRLRYVTDTVRQSVSASHQRISAWLWDGNATFSSPEFDVLPVVDRIGTGDAYMAGLLYGLMNSWEPQRSVTFGAAACALKHTIEGDALLATPNEVETLANGDASGRLRR